MILSAFLYWQAGKLKDWHVLALQIDQGELQIWQPRIYFALRELQVLSGYLGFGTARHQLRLSSKITTIEESIYHRMLGIVLAIPSPVFAA
jgi:hypothetical protein